MGKTSKRKAEILSTAGNFLIVLSVVGVLTILYPVIKEEISYRTSNVFNDTPVSQSFNVMIPSIKINSNVIENVDPWNKTAYLSALKLGIAHAKGSSLPNQKGSVFLFAHSSDTPFNITRYNAQFYRLGKLKKDDEIIVTFKGKEKSYYVTELKEVWPNEVKYLSIEGEDQLVLQTCTPIGTSLKRLLVFATPSENLVVQD